MKGKLLLLFIVLVVSAAAASADIVINEIMQNPTAVTDLEGEYLELYNTGDAAVNVNGWTLSDNNGDTHTITEDVLVGAAGYAILCINANESINGRVACDYQYDDFLLSNGEDEVILTNTFDVEVDRVEYDDGMTFPDPTGASMELTDHFLDNAIGDNWGKAITLFGAGDLGTPGERNSIFEDQTDPVIEEVRNDPVYPTNEDNVEICATVTDSTELEVSLLCVGSNGNFGGGPMTLENGEYCGDISARTINARDGVTVTCTVTATDEEGNEAEEEVGYTYDGTDPVADANGPYACEEGDLIALDASESFDTVDDELAYAWDLDDDGEYDDAFEVDSAFACVDDGNYSVSVMVTDNVGNTDTDDAVITVSNVNPEVDALEDAAGEENTPLELVDVAFSDEGVEDTHNASIDWGDKTVENIGEVTSPLEGLTHTYAKRGEYEITLTVTDDNGGKGTSSLTVMIENAVPLVTAPADAEEEEGSELMLGNVAFTDATGEGIHTASIDWGDGTVEDLGEVTSPISGLSHTYVNDGSYEVTISVTDSEGASGEDTLEVTVTNADPVVTAPADAQGVKEEEIAIGDVLFTDAGVEDTHLVSVDWGDGTVEDLGESESPLAGLSHIYAERGEYIVTIRVMDEADEESFGEAMVTVTVYDISIELSAGWNLFSLPLVPLGNAVDAADVLAGISDKVISVWSYQEGEWRYYRGEEGDTLTTIAPGYGYWIEMAEDDVLFESGEKMFNFGENEQPPTVAVAPGWNLIGHYGTRDDVSRDEALETLLGNYATVLDESGFSVPSGSELTPKRGYWLFLKGAVDLEYAPSEAAYAEED